MFRDRKSDYKSKYTRDLITELIKRVTFWKGSASHRWFWIKELSTAITIQQRAYNAPFIPKRERDYIIEKLSNDPDSQLLINRLMVEEEEELENYISNHKFKNGVEEDNLKHIPKRLFAWARDRRGRVI